MCLKISTSYFTAFLPMRLSKRIQNRCVVLRGLQMLRIINNLPDKQTDISGKKKTRNFEKSLAIINQKINLYYSSKKFFFNVFASRNEYNQTE